MALDRDLKTLVTKRVNRSIVGRTSRILRIRFAITALLAALGVGWWALAGGTKNSGLYNPGHVTQAHAMFENDCEKCHVGNGHGGFSKAVSDAACLVCHDGSMHHPSQLTPDTKHGDSPAGTVLAVFDKTRPEGNQIRSADCASCHSEHGSRAALLGADDSHCTVCHRDLDKATARPAAKEEDKKIPTTGPEATRLALMKNIPAIQNNVLAFTVADHPTFGRQLTAEDPVTHEKRLFDPTKLKFNHQKHLTGVDGLKDAPDSCILCHNTVDAAPNPLHPDRPPFAVDPASWKQPSAVDGKNMLPVNFERHCAGCHQITAPDTVSSLDSPADDDAKDVKPAISNIKLLHRSLGDIRNQIAAQVLKPLSDPAAIAVPDEKDMTDAIKAQSPLQKWLRLNLVATGQSIGRAAKPPFAAAAMALGDAPTADQLSTDKLLDFYTASTVFVGKGSCITCHDVSGSLPSAKADDNGTLATAPTGLPDRPQRWYVNSTFDHSRHTNMSCVECHSSFSGANFARIDAIADGDKKDAETRKVTDTSFVNSPGIRWTEWVSANGRTTEKTRSCVECHHPDTSSARGAGAECITCHQFHDRTKELPVGGAGTDGKPMKSPSTQPAAQVAQANP